MVSQSAAWFALVASEAIPVSDRSVELPGVGSYIAEALAQQNVPAILYAIVALAANIVLLDQLVFRPLVRYTARFKYEDVTASRPLGNPWFYNSLAFSHVGAALGRTRARWLTCGCSSCRGCGTPSACTACFASPPKAMAVAQPVVSRRGAGLRLVRLPAVGILPQTVLRHAAGVDAAHHRARGAAMLLSVAIFTPLGCGSA